MRHSMKDTNKKVELTVLGKANDLKILEKLLRKQVLEAAIGSVI